LWAVEIVRCPLIAAVAPLLCVLHGAGCSGDDVSICRESRMIDFGPIEHDIEGDWVPAPDSSLGSVVLRLGDSGRPVEYFTGCEFCFQFGCESPRDWPLEIGATNEDRGGSAGSGEVKTLVSAVVRVTGYELEWGDPGIPAKMVLDVEGPDSIRFGFIAGEVAGLEMHDFLRKSERSNAAESGDVAMEYFR
jgi:hypothetical protein